MENYKSLISKLVIYFLAIKLIMMFIIIMIDKKQIKELKQHYEHNTSTIDSLYRLNVDSSVVWFQSEIPQEYETMEHASISYDWGKELIIYFKYK